MNNTCRTCGATLPLSMAQAERHAIEQMLEHTKGDKTRAAKLLGIGRKTLYRKLEQYQKGNGK